METSSLLYCLIAYKPDSSDSCRGCLMESFSSDFILTKNVSEATLISEWAGILYMDEKRQRGQACWEVTIMQQRADTGCTATSYIFLDEFDSLDWKTLHKAAEALVVARLQREAEAARLSLLEETKVGTQRQVAAELDQLAKLKAKYETGNTLQYASP